VSAIFVGVILVIVILQPLAQRSSRLMQRTQRTKS